ncbi:type II toxin-antitoxin system RelE/ParE family toxin [Cryomorpha ignava]|uniref:Type II toxin-antitoxin system RelE/ParE family toxin n=1 Tax=Cryomorpha ignava TaxID=101383 RepID=A0A7K3WSY7_9FLAO|nr:type II toxin-antitoxin system RelE/ParE family toxin [Cryomorpha ignava]
MAKRKVNWSTRAKRELNRALAFYTGRNGNSEYSLQILDGLEDLTKTLSRSHFIGRLASDRVTRVIPFKVFLVFYQVQSK